MTKTQLMRPAFLLVAGLFALLSIGIAVAAPKAQEGKGGLFGTVTAVDKGSITLQQDDQTVALKVDSNTKVSIPGIATAQVTDISLGSRVAVVTEQRSDGTYATVIYVIATQPKERHITLTVVEVSGRTIIGETSEGEQVVVELDFDPPPDLTGQVATFVGEQPESNRFKARALQKLENVVERLVREIDTKKRDVQAEQEQSAKELKQNELEDLKARLEDNLREHLDRLAEVASKAPPQSKEALEKALEKIKQGYREAASALEKASGEVDDIIEQRTIVGQVVSLDPATSQIGVRTRGDALTNVNAMADTRIFVDEATGTLSDVHVGDPVQVRFDPKTGVASQIRLLLISQVEGLVKAVAPATDTSAPVLTIELSGGATISLSVPPSATIGINHRPAAIGDITPGMQVAAKYNSRTMQLINLDAELEAEFKLTVEQVDLSGKTITGRTRDGKLVIVKVTEKTQVEAKGAQISIVGLQPGDTITVRINPVTNEALRIVVEEPKEKKKPAFERAQGVIKAIDKDAKTLTLVLRDKSELTLTFGTSTKISADGEEAIPADIQPGMSVTVAYDPQSLAIANMELHRAPARQTGQPADSQRVKNLKVEGTITAVDQAQGTVAIFTRKGEKLVLKVTAQTSLALNGQRLKALSELPAAAAVTVEYSTDGNVAITIVAEKQEPSERTFVVPHVLEAKGTITEVAPAKGVVVIKTEKGETLTLRITADTTVIINVPGRDSRHLGSLSDLASGTDVLVRYTSEGVALGFAITEPGVHKDTGGATLKAKGIMRGGGTTGGSPSVTIVTEQGATLTLTLNADTQIVVDEPGLRQTPKTDFGDRARGASVTVEYTSDNVALRLVINQPSLPSDKAKETQDQGVKQLKAIGMIKGIDTGGKSITIAVGGQTLILRITGDTRLGTNEPTTAAVRRVTSLADLQAGASVEVEYTSDGVLLRLVVNAPGLPSDRK
ncbi:MAG: DUF5666 domain-containing protein [Dehalococcoidia bacterium]|nr:DUF5666 domain-containing protein [Dehalococcoidia bacterium]